MTTFAPTCLVTMSSKPLDNDSELLGLEMTISKIDIGATGKDRKISAGCVFAVQELISAFRTLYDMPILDTCSLRCSGRLPPGQLIFHNDSS